MTTDQQIRKWTLRPPLMECGEEPVDVVDASVVIATCLRRVRRRRGPRGGGALPGGAGTDQGWQMERRAEAALGP